MGKERSRPAQLDRDGLQLVFRKLFSLRVLPLSSVKRVGAIPLPSLVDEIGLMFENQSGELMHIRETDKGFRWLAGQFEIDRLLGDDWYGRAKRGEYLWADVTANPFA